MSETLNAAIEELRDELSESIEQMKQDTKMVAILRLHAALNTMESLVGQPPTSLAAAFALEPTTIVQAGDFYGMNPLKASKRFLKMKGKAAPLDEIISAIRSGGAVVKSVEQLRVSLGRSNQDIAKVGPDHYGLLEFYPHVQRGKKGKTDPDGNANDENENSEANDLPTENTTDDGEALSLDD